MSDKCSTSYCRKEIEVYVTDDKGKVKGLCEICWGEKCQREQDQYFIKKALNG